MTDEDNDISYSRTYQHARCGGQTVVHGETLKWLADPFMFCTGTYCAACKKYGALGAFTWIDTGETVAARRRRLRRSAPAQVKIWGWLLGPLLLAAFGAAITWFLTGSRQEVIGVAIAVVAGAWGVLGSVLAKNVWKINFRAMP